MPSVRAHVCGGWSRKRGLSFPLQVKVDSKTRVDLLKYILKKKQKKENETIDEEAVSCQFAGNGGSTVSQLCFRSPPPLLLD